MGARHQCGKYSNRGVWEITLNCQPLVSATIGSLDVAGQLDAEFGDFVISGFIVSTNATTSTSISIASGSASLKGFLITEDATGSLPVASNATNYIFYQLTLNAANKPTSIAYIATTVESTSNAYRIAKVVSTSIVSSINMEYSNSFIDGRYNATIQQVALF